MRLFAPTIAVVLALVAAPASETTDSIRTIDVRLSRFAFSPERIEVRVGERVRLNLVSMDSTHGFQVKALRVNALVPAGGRTVTVELMPGRAGTFEINCSEYCGRDHSRMKAWLVVRPATHTQS